VSLELAILTLIGGARYIRIRAARSRIPTAGRRIDRAWFLRLLLRQSADSKQQDERDAERDLPMIDHDAVLMAFPLAVSFPLITISDLRDAATHPRKRKPHNGNGTRHLG
jgi:hypothetical protein